MGTFHQNRRLGKQEDELRWNTAKRRPTKLRLRPFKTIFASPTIVELGRDWPLQCLTRKDFFEYFFSRISEAQVPMGGAIFLVENIISPWVGFS